MSSSIGRIALGFVGALIGAPFGLSAVGFSIGSAIGGALFAPDGPKTEGPRLGDTNVSASSLGKVITEHYGVTRTAGNIVWSAGLKEVKKTEKVGGGKGGSPPTNTTYTYFASFASVFGRGPAQEVRKMWADGKLIYDGTGESETNNEKYAFRFRSGGPDQVIDPLIEESINRRLKGLPDVSDGNQEDPQYTTIGDLITAADTAGAAGDARAALYADLLSDRRDAAELAAGLSGIPDYRFTPAFKEFCYIVFDDIPLEDFGNRIPNITAEIVWKDAAAEDGLGAQSSTTATGKDVPEIAPQPVPSGLMAVDYRNKKVFSLSGSVMRRFSSDTKSEDLQGVINVPTPHLAPLEVPSEFEDYGFTVSKLLCVGINGTVFAWGTRSSHTFLGGLSTSSSLLAISGTGLAVVGPNTLFNPGGALNHGAALRIGGRLPSGVSGSDSDPEHAVFSDDNNLFIARFNGSEVATSISLADTGDILAPNSGPLVAGGSNGEGVAQFFHITYGPLYTKVTRYEVTNNYIKNQTTGGSELSCAVKKTRTFLPGGFGAYTHVVAMVWNSATNDITLSLATGDGKTMVLQLDSNLDTKSTNTINVAPPGADCGLTRSATTNGTFAFASGKDIVSVKHDGTYKIFADTLAAPASSIAQFYDGTTGSLLLWEAGVPRIYRVGRASGVSRNHDIAALLPNVLKDICERSGMLPEEFDISGVGDYPVRGYSITRQSSGRQVMENLLQAFFVDGIESDWKVKFADRTTDSIRTINENELGEISGPTGAVNWLESRTPEYEVAAEININYSDPLRDYQTGTSNKKRISNPIPSMYSDTTENIELPMVLKEYEAADIAERLLYLGWMSRDRAKSMLNWTHADLDPGDVVSIKFNDGRIVTDRISKATLGANFEIELESARANDPVYISAPQTIIPTGSIPSNGVTIPVNSRGFVFDIPLLYDYHDGGRTASRFYTAVGADSARWRSATFFGSWDNGTFSAIGDAVVDVTWGTLTTRLKEPRALWSTDRENVITVALSIDNGDLVSVTREEILNGENRALIWNPTTGIGEIIQFQTVTVSDTGTTYELTDLVRGLRGTEYAVDKHLNGAYFIMLQDSAFQINDNELGRIGTVGYFKAVSAGQLVTAVQSSSIKFAGNDLKPWAPSRVRRTVIGSDLQVSWNRRTRVGGAWNMAAAIETVPLSEDFEQYEIYLLPNTVDAISEFDPTNPSTYLVKEVTSSPSFTFLAATLTAHGLTTADAVNVAVYQISGQVGRGFQRIGTLAP